MSEHQGKKVQVGYFIYLTTLDGFSSQQYESQLKTALSLVARIRRVSQPEVVEYVMRQPNPDAVDPLGELGSAGVKGYGYVLPWYQGWFDSVIARIQLRFMEGIRQ